jgi:hypothetical protein
LGHPRECTSGTWRSDEDLRRDKRLTQKAIDNGVYLTSLDLNAAKAALYLMNYLYFKTKENVDIEQQVRYLANALLLNPKCSHSLTFMGRELIQTGRNELAKQFIQHAKNLGINTDYEMRMLAGIQSRHRMRQLLEDDFLKQQRQRRKNRGPYPSDTYNPKPPTPYPNIPSPNNPYQPHRPSNPGPRIPGRKPRR